MVKKWETDDKVCVLDPDGTRWNGVVAGPSVLWADWYMVRPDKPGKSLGKVAVYTVHTRDMVVGGVRRPER
jgi:hypothetical protein